MRRRHLLPLRSREVDAAALLPALMYLYSAPVLVSQQVIERVVMELHVREDHHPAERAVGRILAVEPFKDKVDAPWDQARVVRGACDSVRLSGARTAVREHSGVETVDGVDDERPAHFEHRELGGVTVINPVELELR